MTTVVLVHGTGVRTPAFDKLSARFERGLAAASPQAGLVAKCWGDVVGATLGRGGASIPLGRSERSIQPTLDDEVAIWALLERDPLFELTLLAAAERGELPPHALPAARAVQQVTDGLASDGQLRAALAEVDLDTSFFAAIAWVQESEVYSLALTHAAKDDVMAVLPRALLAAALRKADDDGLCLVDGDSRDHLHQLLRSRFGTAASRGPLTGLAKQAGRIMAEQATAWHTDRRRVALTSAVSPTAGDILVYLSRGEAMRDHLRRTIMSVPDQVVVVGHSLGGVIAFEILSNDPPGNVGALVTAGSQAAFLYELNALPLRPFSASAAGGTFPPLWTNVYDSRDLLSFMAEPIFGSKVVSDVAMDSRVAFPRAHSAYFANKSFYGILANVISAVEGKP